MLLVDDIVNQLAETLKFKMIVNSTMDTQDIIENFTNKEIDIGSGLFVMTNKRLNFVDYSQPIMTSKTFLYIKSYNDYVPSTIYYKVRKLIQRLI